MEIMRVLTKKMPKFKGYGQKNNFCGFLINFIPKTVSVKYNEKF